jgi:hypothetical protein
MRLRKVVLFVALVTLSTAGMAVEVTQVGASTQNPPSMSTKCILVPNAKIVLTNKKPQKRNTSPWKSALSEANHGQEIMTGNGYVLSIRQFQGGDAAVDSATFLKVTLALELTELKIAESQEIHIPIVDGYYVQGAVGFVHKREYWQARNPARDVVLKRLATGLTAKLQSTFTANYMASGESKPVDLDISCGVVETAADRLKSWEGKPGADWSSFAPEH